MSKYKFLIICLIVYSSVFGSQLPNFDELKRDPGVPSNYTILSLDTSFIKNVESNLEPSPWYEKFINQKLFEEETIWNNSPEEKTDSIVTTKHVKGETPYIVISLERIQKTTGAENLTNIAMGISKSAMKKTFAYSASMILFCKDYNKNTKVIYPYVFGKWTGIINSNCIVPSWGLRVITNKDVYVKTKELKRRDFRNTNPASYTEKRNKLEKLDQFKIDVGSDEIEGLTTLTKFSKKHTCKGNDIFQFSFSMKSNKNGKGSTLQSLRKIHAFISQMNPEIHPDFSPYIDQMIEDEGVINKLEGKILRRLNGKKKDLSMFFIHQNLWKSYGRSPLFSLNNKDWFKSPLKALEDKKIKFEDMLYIKKNRQQKSEACKEIIWRYLFSIPFEYNNEFYRLDRGRWFKVDENRFEAISNILREYKIYSDKLNLPKYDVTNTSTEGEYNDFSVKEMNKKGSNCDAILLDKKNIKLSNGRGNIFEFSDILRREKKDIYLIHVKRAKVSQLSHLREQIERCAEYLGSNLNRSKDEKVIKNKDFDEIKKALFSNGTLNKKTRNRITIVLAMIDDKQSKEPLFKKQDLWGLDRTRQLVMQYGFSFIITVINEKPPINGKDIFGAYPLVKSEQTDSNSDEDDTYNNLKKKIEGFAKKQKKVFKSGEKKGNIKISPFAKLLDVTPYKLKGFLIKQKHLEEVKEALKKAEEDKKAARKALEK